MQRSSAFLQRILPSLSAGLVIGVLVIFVEISFAALIFSGDLAIFTAQGIGILLFGAFLVGIIGSLTSSFLTTVTVPQDAPTAICAVIGAAIIAEMSTAAVEQVFATVVAAILLSTVFIGGVFWLMGHFNLGRLVRFLPYPVVGGFLGGTGWLLLTGGIGVMTDVPLDFSLLQSEVLMRWLPGLLFGFGLLILLRRFSHFLLMPSLLFAGIGAFYLIYYLSTGTIETAGEQGWLLGPFPEGGLWQPVTILAFSQADWSVVFRNVANLSTILLVGTISLLLNASGLEITSRRDIDLNQELKSSGMANLLAGFFGSPACYPSLSLSSLGLRLGAKSRMVGIFSSLVVGFALFFGAAALSVFPRMIAGGFLVFLGLSFLVEWVYDAWFKLPFLDYLLIWLILIVIATVGFLEGVAVGILVAVILFVLKYSGIQVMRHTLTGADYESHVMRPYLYQQLLRERGDGLYIIELQGFIFFGSAQRLFEQIRDRIENTDIQQLRFIVLDFRLVTGVDSSAAFSFSRLEQLTSLRTIKMVFTNLSPEIQARFEKDFFGDNGRQELYIFSNIDQGVAWCEEQMLETFNEVGLVAKPKTLFRLLEENLPAADTPTDWEKYLDPYAEPGTATNLSRLKRYFECLEVEAGESLIAEGDEGNGLYFIENGQISAQMSFNDDDQTEVRILESGTVFGEIDYYTEQEAKASYKASKPSVLFHISVDKLKRMDREDPELAIIFHRFIASILGKKLIHTSRTTRAFQR